MELFTYQLLVFVLICTEYVNNYPTGAPTDACSAMTPGHGSNTAQSCSAMYTIQADKTQYYPNDTVLITVSGATGSNTFRGILLQARTLNGNQIIGTWTVVGSTTQALACNSVTNSAITHNSRDDKTSVQAIWTPPSTITETTTVIKATVVSVYNTFFVNCFNVTLTAKQANISTNATTVAASSTTAVASTTITTTTIQPIVGVQLAVNWTYASGVTSVKMQITNLQASQWCAFGLSLDKNMGEDHVFVCKYLSTYNVVVERRINPGGYSPPVLGGAGGVFNSTTQKVENGVVSCEFTLSGFTSSKRRRRAIASLSQTTSYYPLIAIGNLDSSNNLIQHTSVTALSQTVQLNQAASFSYNADGGDSSKTPLMKAHGIIMIFTWILFVSTGVLIARYFKTVWPERKICGKAVWFAIHRAVMFSVAILTIIAFVLILVFESGQWIPRNETREFAHSIVGILVICFAIVQPIMALFRCAPDAQYRFIFNYVHATVGFLAFILSVVAIFIGMFLSAINPDGNKRWGIVLAWTIWLPVIFGSFQFVEFYFKQQESRQRTTNSYDLSNTNGHAISPDQTKEIENNPTRDRIKIILLVIHILVALGLALALAILVGQI
ncbi:unnamed protein product [Adineta ricciae]|uniref:Ferric-chelate reductase 1 n=1 Tax=Adineta ricciae TaxID=249248 RepID=A0A814LGN5_ADIRI|nr:unnamed protein product [Adineta ricciae]CAF1064765.1 unnamed protein product [Adineta ricciae]